MSMKMMMTLKNFQMLQRILMEVTKTGLLESLIGYPLTGLEEP
ncbi:hypothetical protein L195_g039366 [Trifolium pratense]|uniref:Uncharacterized protein n=1 Tax=Trifolium pratense TaxID=57577 RepID=A0A2K3L7C7_TRIPR|nr:hypothetical protein L195_g030352 [Trifolium pratense]PNX83325.1 hypothetical protein L195_g039366 [Trifolium pratense]